jgi:hypothetical protein
MLNKYYLSTVTEHTLYLDKTKVTWDLYITSNLSLVNNSDSVSKTLSDVTSVF